VVLSLVPPELRPQTYLPRDFEHFAIFACTGVALCLGYVGRLRLLTVAVTMVIFAGAIEIAQFLVAGRHARVSDFIVDASAVCIGLFAASFVSMRMIELGARIRTSTSPP
jgi:VanZ family protein